MNTYSPIQLDSVVHQYWTYSHVRSSPALHHEQIRPHSTLHSLIHSPSSKASLKRPSEVPITFPDASPSACHYIRTVSPYPSSPPASNDFKPPWTKRHMMLRAHLFAVKLHAHGENIWNAECGLN